MTGEFPTELKAHSQESPRASNDMICPMDASVYQLSLESVHVPALLCSLPGRMLQAETEAERQKLVSYFQQLHHVLEEQERLLLAQLEELDPETAERIEKTKQILQEIPGACELLLNGRVCV